MRTGPASPRSGKSFSIGNSQYRKLRAKICRSMLNRRWHIVANMRFVIPNGATEGRVAEG